MDKMLTVLRVFTVLLMIIGTFFALIFLAPGAVGLYLSITDFTIWGILLTTPGLATVLTVSICCWRALLRFFAMCGRLKSRSAFTDDNCLALGFIARQCALAGTALAGGFAFFCVMCWLNDASENALFILIRLMPLPALLLIAGLMIWAVHLLMGRALALQQENDLTV